MQYKNTDHTFVVCAYKDNPYLEECIRSILAQSVLGSVIITTSTPNDFVKQLSERCGIPLYINPKHTGQAGDWNFGYTMAKTPLVTLCHQDDIYAPDYLKEIMASAASGERPIMIFTDYEEDHSGRLTHNSCVMRIKRAMLLPLRLRPLQRNRFVRRCILAFGDPICCPAVTLNKSKLPDIPFDTHFSRCPDWEAWERFSTLKGSFIYCPKRLVIHRIWDGSITSQCAEDGSRFREELKIFERFWPHSAAKLLSRLYSTALDTIFTD